MIPIIIRAVDMLFHILTFMVIARVIVSWLPMIRHGRVVAFLFAFTEPMLAPVRRLVDRSPLGGPGMMLDFSPIITLFLLALLRSFIRNMLWMVAVF